MERIFPALESDLVDLHDQKFSTNEIVSFLSTIVTEERLEKLKKCATHRSAHASIILDNTYDEGNINAVMRTMENFGFFQLYLFQSTKTKVTPRITRGADKWLAIKKMQGPEDLMDLKKKGIKLYATTLDDQAKDFRAVDWSRPVSLVIGNEKDGVRPEIIEYCDEKIIIPTTGLSESLNLSVAASVIMSYLRFSIFPDLPNQGNLNEEMAHRLLRNYLMTASPLGLQMLCKKRKDLKSQGSN